MSDFLNSSVNDVDNALEQQEQAKTERKEIKMTEDELSKFMETYQTYKPYMKHSVCECAFRLSETFHCPPHHGIFVLARSIGYVIPDKWKDLYK